MGTIKGEVTKLIKKFQTNNPFEIANQLNIHVNFHDLINTYGFYSSYRRSKFININNKLPESLQWFVCSHELGHAILHPEAHTPFLRKNTFYSIDKIEVEANLFAVELMIPDEMLKEYENTDMTIFKVAEACGVPKELIHLKKFNL